MVLIDQQTLDRLGKTSASSESKQLQNAQSTENPIRDVIIALRNDMKQILRLKGVDDDEKLSRYLETLRRYLHFISLPPKFCDKTNKPCEKVCEEQIFPLKKEFKRETIDDQQESIPSNESNNAADLSDAENQADDNNLLQQVLQSVSKPKRDAANELYSILSTSKLIDWDNQTGTVTLKGNVIDNSSIVELISDATRNRQTTYPTGWQAFTEVLDELQIPLKYISNIRSKKFIRSKHNEATTSPNLSVQKRNKRKITDQSPVSPQGNKRIKRRSTRVLTTNWKRFHF